MCLFPWFHQDFFGLKYALKLCVNYKDCTITDEHKVIKLTAGILTYIK